ncbi:adenosine deaminase [Candidatus Gracilibacteria bacterium]|nr:adenosine deaminase [Candidatus Gracilibacteria bacterium]
MTTTSLNDFIQKIPKAELHLHIEGTLEPELMLSLAQRNNIRLPFASVDELKKAYSFSNLQDFLDIYYQGAAVLQTEEDFYDLTFSYLKKAHSQGVVHTELFFDPQTHTDRGIPFKTVIDGIMRACEQAATEFGISTKRILCFLRHLDEESAMKTLEQALPYKDSIIAVGLDSSEVNNPPSKFERVFKKAREAGFLVTAHAGEEGPPSYVWEALNLLRAARIDHGNNALQDESLVKELVQKRIPLTVCPLSNLKLKVVKDLHEHPLKKMMEAGLLVSINSDDPAYFGGYIADNYQAITEALNLSKEEIIQLAKNSFQSSFLTADEKREMITKIEDCIHGGILLTHT